MKLIPIKLRRSFIQGLPNFSSGALASSAPTEKLGGKTYKYKYYPKYFV